MPLIVTFAVETGAVSVTELKPSATPPRRYAFARAPTARAPLTLSAARATNPIATVSSLSGPCIALPIAIARKTGHLACLVVENHCPPVLHNPPALSQPISMLSFDVHCATVTDSRLNDQVLVPSNWSSHRPILWFAADRARDRPCAGSLSGGVAQNGCAVPFQYLPISSSMTWSIDLFSVSNFSY